MKKLKAPKTSSRKLFTRLKHLKKNKDIYIYFDNGDSGYAVNNALELQDMLLS